MELLTPEQMAERAKDQRQGSYADIAEELGCSKSAVGNALAYPSTRRIKMIARILRSQGTYVELTPHYPVSDQ